MGQPEIKTRTRRTPASQRLLDAADELFYRDGIARTGVDDVLECAQVAPGTMYAHFGGKDGLIVAALKRRLQRWDQVWQEAVDATTAPEDRLLAIFEAVALYRNRYIPGRGCPFLATLTELPQDDHPARDVILAETVLLRDRLTELAHDVETAEPALLAEQVLLAYDGAMSGFLRAHHTDPLRQGRTVAQMIIQSHRTRSQGSHERGT